MARFIAYRDGVELHCYLKCGFTSIAHMRRDGLLDDTPTGPVRMRVAIVRHPHRRIESFYKDKLVEAPAAGGPLQECQAALGEHFAQVDLALGAVTLRSFVVDGMGRGYADSHLEPLADHYPPVDATFDLDSPAAMERLGDLLGVQVLHENRTFPQVFRWTRRMRRVVRRTHDADFRRFGYRA